MAMLTNQVRSEPTSVAKAVAVSSDGTSFRGREVTTWTGYERNYNLTGREAIRTYTRILNNNSTAWALFYVQNVMLKQVQLTVVPGKNAKLTKIFEESLENLRSKWLLGQASMSLPFGYSLVEYNLKVNKNGYLVLDGLRQIPQMSVENWGYSEEANAYTSVKQSGELGSRQTEIPLWKCFHFRLSPSFDESPEGRSQLRTAVRPFQYIETIQESEGIGIDRDLTGIPQLQVPVEITLDSATDEERAKYEQAKVMVASIRQGTFAGLVLPSETLRDGTPSGWKFSVVTSGGGKMINTNEIVKRYEVEILMLGLFEVLILGMQGKPGSNALASEQTSFGAMAVGAEICSSVDEINEKLGTALVELNNFGHVPPEDRPKFGYTDIEKIDFKAVGEFISKMASYFPKSPEIAEYLHGLIDAPFDKQAVEKLLAQAEELKNKLGVPSPNNSATKNTQPQPSPENPPENSPQPPQS